jgi:hypothetical protein
MLVYFTRNKTLQRNAPIIMQDITIQASSEAKYLGVTFDQELRFKTHLQHATENGTKFTMAMSRIAGTKWGAEIKHVKTLSTAVVAPRIDYAASIWHRPKEYQKSQTTS